MLIPWRCRRPLTWDVTIAHSLAGCYVSAAARSGGAAAEQAACRKSVKYDLLVQTGHLFQPITVETLGPLNESSITFFPSWAERSHWSQETIGRPAFFLAHFSHCSALQLHLVAQQLSQRRQRVTTPTSVFNFWL